MSDDIDVQLPGSTAVATDALLEQHDHLAALAFALREAEALVCQAAALGHYSPAGVPRAQGERDELVRATAELRHATQRASDLCSDLLVASGAYSDAEDQARRFADATAGVAGTGAGMAAAGVIGLLGPVALALPFLFHQEGAHQASGADDLSLPPEVNRWLADPATVELIRAGITGLDDFFRALGRVPVPLGTAAGTGDDDAGQVTAAALAVLATGKIFGLFETTGAGVTKVRSSTTEEMPDSLEGLIERIPGTQDGQTRGSIRIDSWTDATGQDHAAVYIAGTEDFSLVPGQSSLDFTSNVEGSAQQPMASMASVKAALADAGVSQSTPVSFIGYSQGGLLASAAAASGDFTVESVLTIGNPAGNIPTPADVPAVLLQHREDLVTALGGNQTNDNALRITRQVFDSPDQIPTDQVVPAHHLEHYLRTAAIVDHAQSQAVNDVVSKVAGIGKGATTVESRWYDAIRVN
jgi:hypothetical protein